MRLTASLVGIAVAMTSFRVAAQELTVSQADTAPTIVAGQKGKRITLRLRFGQELTGTVKEATPKLVVLAGIQGREFFDAAVPVEMIEAVLVRNRP